MGGITSQAEVITPDQMEYLWQNGFLGSDTPELLRNIILFLFGNCFALRAGQEHRNLRMKNSQLSLYTRSPSDGASISINFLSQPFPE